MQVCHGLDGNEDYHWLNSLSLCLSSGKPAIPVSFSSDQNIVCMYNLTAHKACKHCYAFWSGVVQCERNLYLLAGG